MQELSIEEIRAIQLSILKDVAGFCEKNDIKYSLSAGTLLGAVRHRGYIPWDDDIDIMMLRPDFEKFNNHYYSKDYSLQNFVTNPNYKLPFAKVSNKCTITIGEGFEHQQIGVHIDIFPIDGFAPSTKLQKRQAFIIRFLRGLLSTSYFTSNPNYTFIHNLAVRICKHLIRPISQRSIAKAISKACQKYRIEDCIHAGNLVWGYRGKEYNPKTVFYNLQKMPFENNLYNCSVDYDIYLTTLFGDYMKLPPIEDRVTTHSVRYCRFFNAPNDKIKQKENFT